MALKPNKYNIIFAVMLLLVVVGVVIMMRYEDHAFALAKDSLATLRLWQAQSPLLFAAGYAALYIFAMLIFLPADTIFMILAGAIYSLPVGAILACTVHTTGTMSTFYISRYLLHRGRDLETPKPPATRKQIVSAWFTLVLLRLAPLIPTHAISMGMASSPLSARGFYTATWCGSLPLTLFMVFVGGELAHIDSLDDIVTPEMTIGLVGLMLLMASAKVIYMRWVKE